VCKNDEVKWGSVWRVGVVGMACAIVVAPWPAEWVEHWYSRTVFVALQVALTGASNVVPFALIDVLIGIGAVACGCGVWRVMAAGRGHRLRAGAKSLGRLAVALAVLAITFMACWGLNYRREAITVWVDFSEDRVIPERVRALAFEAVAQLTAIDTRLARATSDGDLESIATRLKPAFAAALQSLGLPARVRPGRPKHSLLDSYFSRAGVSGMTDPFLLETIVAGNLIPVERPAVVAHEWAHLAGVARESEASFVGWLTCVRADPASAYSGWLDLFLRLAAALDPEDRRAVIATLPRRAVEHIGEMRRRNSRDHVRAIGDVAWRTYDSYLKANRVSSGVRNYDEVVRLVAGTRFDTTWVPALK
jgi:hypothetical protein